MPRRAQRIIMMLCLALAAVFFPATASFGSHAGTRGEFAFPRVRVTAPEAERPIELRALDVRAEVAEGFALTAVEMTFYNPNSRVLEGGLEFPLLDGQTVTGFALSVGEGKNEVMRDAVPVDKGKGRQTFESIERRNVDPALLEMTRGNNFKMRVYPLNPGGTRRVRVVYSERLREGSDGAAVYFLPPGYLGQTAKFTARVSSQGGLKPEIDWQPHTAQKNFSSGVRRDGSEWLAEISAESAALDGVVSVKFPGSRPGDAAIGARNGATYFAARLLSPPLGGRRALSRVSILWDASMSGLKRDVKKELAFLDAFFGEVKNVSVDLQVARDSSDARRAFDVRGGDWGELRKILESAVFDGATNLGAFDARASSDAYLLFSDGLDNYSLAPMGEPGSPLYAVVSSAVVDLPALRRVARGGVVIDLSLTDASGAVSAVLSSRARVAAVDGTGVSDVYWRPDGTDSYIVAGVVDGANPSVRVTFDTPGGEARRVELDVAPDDGAPRSDVVPYLWVSMKLDELSAEYDLNRGEIRRLGREFGVATRETSLIVLDSAADYVTYDIAPPPELKDECDRIRAASPRRGGSPAKMERVLGEWRALGEWWDKDFPKGRMPKGEVSSFPRAGELRPLAGEDASSSAARGLTSGAGDFSMSYDGVSREQSFAAPSSKNMQSGASGGGAKIYLRPWSPDEPYIRRMRDARDGDVYRIYLDERPDYENSAAFYIDAAYQLRERGQGELSLRVLSNLAEMELENRQILRVLGYRLMEAGKNERAAAIFRRVLAIAGDEPQSHRDLGLACGAAGMYQAAVDNLYYAATLESDRAFPGIEVIALTEMNAVIAEAGAKRQTIDTSRIDPRFIAERPLDLRVVLTWDADDTDIDLHVTDPNGDEAFYGRALSYQGGRVSPDNTVGYGPEEFSLKSAKPGKYIVEVKFYGHTQQIISESTAIQLDFFTGYGTPGVKKQSVTMRLKDAGERIFVGEFEVL